ncbi:MAG: cytochrome c biogenesis protein CcsA [Planctomycetes bacterium]|nr:cytochrome c biogenesis protein CcsA [Planctomycetota bacterium]
MTNRMAALAVCVACLAPAFLCPPARADQPIPPQAADFIRRLDPRALGLIRVQYEGRVAILDTLARRQIRQMCGPGLPDDLPAAGIYLELYFNAGFYLDRPIIFIKDPAVRNLLAGAMEDPARQELIGQGRLAPWMLMDRQWADWLVKSRRAGHADIRRVEAMPLLTDALNLAGGRPELKLSLDRLSLAVGAFVGTGDFRMAPLAPDWMTAMELALLDRSEPFEQLFDLKTALAELTTAWRARDAGRTNEALRLIGRLQMQVYGVPATSPLRAEMELAFNRINSIPAAVVAVCALAAVLALLSAGGIRKTRIAAVAALLLAAATLTGLFIVRWLLGGRDWFLPPIMNMYEAVFASAMLASAVAAVGEFVRRRNRLTPAASLYALLAVLGCNWLDEGIYAQHGILNSSIMAAHVAIIIVGHAMAGMTCLLSVGYLIGRLRSRPAGLAAMKAGPDASPGSFAPPVLSETLSQIDRCTAMAAKWALLLVAAGTMLGAFWGDIAWGRWWGWDPKETWALITILIYLLIVHVRAVLPAGRRELATALLCLLGAAVMLFNWIVVNFFIAGKHSYA